MAETEVFFVKKFLVSVGVLFLFTSQASAISSRTAYISLYNPKISVFYLRNSYTGGNADTTIQGGATTIYIGGLYEKDV